MLSQASMVMHWRKVRGPAWMQKAFGIGAFVTGVTVVVVLVAKFVDGAWITLIFIPLTIGCFVAVRRHYHSVRMLTACKIPVSAASLAENPIVVIPVDHWSDVARGSNLQLVFHRKLSFYTGTRPNTPNRWNQIGNTRRTPFRKAGKDLPKLAILPSPYRFVVVPIVQFVLDLSKKDPRRSIIVC
jgi:hypothetical protein